jgi:hypothetical protein
MKIIKKAFFSCKYCRTQLHSRFRFCKLSCAHETEFKWQHFFYRRRNLCLRPNIKEGQTTTASHKVFQDALLLDQSNISFLHYIDVCNSQKNTARVQYCTNCPVFIATLFSPIPRLY